MKKSLGIFTVLAIVLMSGLTLSAQAKPLGENVPTATPGPVIKVVHEPRSSGSVSAEAGITDISVQSCTNPVLDPSFEAYTPNPDWYEYSYQFGTPLCNTTDCPSGAPHSGTTWAWFGGVPQGYNELGVVSQTVTIMTDTASLNFYLRIISNGGGADDFFQVFIDDTEVFTVTAAKAGSYNTYKSVSVNASPFADGAAHSLQFWGETIYQNVNFFLDDVSVCSFVVSSKVYLPSIRR
jgi:hypothetical protein